MYNDKIKINVLYVISLNIAVTALYAITGYLGLFLATSSGYATAFWIPSGIALGVVLVWGLYTLPGVFFGSFIINYFISFYSVEHYHLALPFIIGSGVALGATLQAFVAWYMIKRWVGLDNPLNRPNDILLFAFLSGPASCLINATWSNSLLLLLGAVPSSDFFLSWGTWWVGDSIGVLMFTPVFLILFGAPRALWRQRIVPIFLPLVGCFIAVVVAYWSVNVTSTAKLINSQNSWQIWLTLVSGLLFCVLINIILFIIQGQKNIAQALASEKDYALKSEEEKNILILRSAGEGIFGVDADCNITFINPAAANILGYDEKDLLGKNMKEIIHGHYANGRAQPKSEYPIYAAMKEDITSHITDEVFWRKNGSKCWVEYICTPLKNGKQTTGAVVVFTDITQRRQAATDLEKMAHYDSLTELPNRVSFLDTLTMAIARAERNNREMAVCFIDLDNFKQINDSMGHSVGDNVLKIIAKTLKPHIRKMDYFARLGGDEFALIIENIQSTPDIISILDQCMNVVSVPFEINRVKINISMSIGVATYPDAGKTSEELIKNADIAMYRAKELGKNTYAFFDDEINKQVQRRHQLDRNLRNAIKNDEFDLAYQFHVDTLTLKPHGVEALLRWDNHFLGSVSPAEFIPIAEGNGLINEIGEWVIHRACSDFKNVIEQYGDLNLILAINVSLQQLINQNFSNAIKKILSETNIPGECLLLEVTESALMKKPEASIKVMAAIDKLDIKFALDDFGVSYSSIQYLKNLPISLIKIDQSFVRDMLTNKNNAAIVNGTIQLSHALEIKTMAEGVETEEQFIKLKQMGCEYVQGYYFSHPMNMEGLIKALQTHLQKWVTK